MICPECNEEMDVVDRGFEREHMLVWSEWCCPKCGAEVSRVEDVDDNQLDCDDLGFLREVKPKTDPNEM